MRARASARALKLFVAFRFCVQQLEPGCRSAHTASTSTRSRLTSAIAEPCDARVGSTGSFSSPRARGGADCTTSFCCANGQSHCGQMYRRVVRQYAHCGNPAQVAGRKSERQRTARCARAHAPPHLTPLTVLTYVHGSAAFGLGQRLLATIQRSRITSAFTP